MKTIANILTTTLTDIIAAAILVASALIHLYIVGLWGTDNEIGVVIAVFGTVIMGYVSFAAVCTLVIKDWRRFAAMITFLVLGWGSLALSNWLFNNHDIVPHIELSAFVFVLNLIFTPAIAAGIAQEE
jgi:hypothetical protein